jgi:enoyl-[acyl-carrier protein] reductase III
MLPEKFLKNKTVLVTGSGRGIGSAIAVEFAKYGADVIVNYNRNRKPAEETALKIETFGSKATIIRANIGKEEGIEDLFSQIQEQVGKLDILVNNAATGFNRPALQQKFSGWDYTMDVNARAALFCAQKANPFMKQAGQGWIINISSPGSQRVLPDYISVGASKAALESLTRYLAVEFAPDQIRVNAIAPGIVETDALKHFSVLSDLDTIPKTIKNTPAGRLVLPEDVAKLAVMLCSPAADMICGQVITQDGGFTLVVPN